MYTINARNKLKQENTLVAAKMFTNPARYLECEPNFQYTREENNILSTSPIK